MKTISTSLDKSAITLSALCLAHCLLLPLVTVLLPTVIATTMNQEVFHTLMVVCVLPISIYALTMGCKKHNKMSIGLYGGFGLIILASALFFGESYFGEIGEKGLTTLGAIVIAFAHIKNYKLCQKADNCSC
jgi:hypothetical protein